MLTLYGSPGSGSAAVEAGLDIGGLAYRTVDAASWKPSPPGLDELRRINPIAQIPTLVLDDGSILTESAAILIHLGLAHPASGWQQVRELRLDGDRATIRWQTAVTALALLTEAVRNNGPAARR